MPRWTIDSPQTLDFDGIVALRVRMVAGSVAVLTTEGRPRLDVTEVIGPPLLVTHEAGILTIGYEDLTLSGLRSWIRPQRHSANITVTVQKDCPAQLGTVNAAAVISGVSARTSLKSVSGDLTLDGVTGSVEANTVSGNLEAQSLNGSLVFHSVSGDLTVADGRVGRIDARTVSGRVTADVDLTPAGEMRVSTLSGEVAIRIPAQASARLSLRSASGQVHSDFDGLASSPGARNVTGTLGGGSGRLSVASMSGDVTILRGCGRATADDDAPAEDDVASTGDGPAPPGAAAAAAGDGAAAAGDGAAAAGDGAAAAEESAATRTGGQAEEGEAR